MSHDLFELGTVPLESGQRLTNAQLAYKTHGTLNDERDNAVLLPSFITGTHEGYRPFIGPGRCFDPERHFIVATNLLGNGLSTSPSNASPEQRGPSFPHVSIRDNVQAQQRLLGEHLGVRRLALVAGFSMGAQQAYQWAVSYPEFVTRVAAWCGHARTTSHTKVFLRSLRTALELASDWNDGRYDERPQTALKALARIYAPWGLSQEWYRREGWLSLGFASLEQFLQGFWEATMANIEPNDFLAQVTTWSAHNVGDTPGYRGDWRQALASVRAEALIMPCITDMYFTEADARAEAQCIRNARFQPLVSDWGHFAGIGIDEKSRAVIDSAITELLHSAVKH